MILIFEGLDKSGKSTLIDCIEGIKIKNYYLPKDGSDAERQKIKDAHQLILGMIEKFKDSSYHVILDRSPISEIVYSKVRRGYEATDDPDWMKMVHRLHGLGVLVFYCTAEDDELWQRCKEHADPDARRGEISELKERYLKVLGHGNIAYRELNTSKTGIAECLQDIQYVIERLGGELGTR